MPILTKKNALGVLVLILLVQFFLRAHHITTLPVFIDEDNHIRRAAAVYDLAQHPAQNSHGKFFLYLLLGFFDLDNRATALHVARTVLGLVSLLTTALIVASLRLLHPHKTQIPALIAAFFYALVPYALFFERLAFADPWAGTLGVLTLWASIRLAKQPSYARAAWVGASAAATVAAKLTMSFAVGFPLVAFLLLGGRPSPRRLMPFLLVAGVVFTLLWLPVLVPAWVSYGTDSIDDFVLVNTELVEDGSNADSLLTKLGDTWHKFNIMTWGGSPLGGLLCLVLVALAGYQHPKTVLFLLACLALAWLPSILLVRNLQTRYLMSGVPFLALLWGMAALGKRQQWAVTALTLGTALVWWLPFATQLSSNPPALHLPALDAQNYLWDRYNGYGNREALAFLAAKEPGGAVVFPLVKVCRQLDLHPQPNLELVCIAGYEQESLAAIDWQPAILAALTGEKPVYTLTSEQNDPPDQSAVSWQQIAVFPKPLGIQNVTVWRLIQNDNKPLN